MLVGTLAVRSAGGGWCTMTRKIAILVIRTHDRLLRKRVLSTTPQRTTELVSELSFSYRPLYLNSPRILCLALIGHKDKL